MDNNTILSNKQLSRRNVLLGGAASLAGSTASLIGCRNSQARRISVLYFAGLAEGKRLQRLGPAFEEEKGIEVRFHPEKYDDIRQRQIESFNRGRPDYDVIFVDDIWMYEYVQKKYILDLTDFIQRDQYDYDDFIPKVVAAEGMLSDRKWLIPQRADVQVLFYNRRILEDPAVATAYYKKMKKPLAVPQTWEEYAEVARGLSGLEHAGNKIVGCAETLKRPHFAFEFFATRYWSLTGKDFLDVSGNPIFAEPGGVAALEYVKSLEPYWAPGSLAAGHDETINMFSAGQVALMPQWYAFYAVLKNRPTIADQFGVALMPGVRNSSGNIQRTPSIGGGSLGISRKSAYIEDAWAYIKYMTAPDVMKDAALAGEIITRQSAYENPLVAKNNPAVGVYRDSLDQSKFRPRAVAYAEIERAIGGGVARALAGEASPSDALSQAAQAVIDVQRTAG